MVPLGNDVAICQGDSTLLEQQECQFFMFNTAKPQIFNELLELDIN